MLILMVYLQVFRKVHSCFYGDDGKIRRRMVLVCSVLLITVIIALIWGLTSSQTPLSQPTTDQETITSNKVICTSIH